MDADAIESALESALTSVIEAIVNTSRRDGVRFLRPEFVITVIDDVCTVSIVLRKGLVEKGPS